MDSNGREIAAKRFTPRSQRQQRKSRLRYLCALGVQIYRGALTGRICRTFSGRSFSLNPPMPLPLRYLACVLALAAVSTPAALLHRYSFTDGAKDSTGHVDGKLKGAGASIANGKLVLKGNDEAYEEKVACVEPGGSVLPPGGK